MNIYDLKVKDISGEEISMAEYRGKVLLIVNSATACGFTPQYEGLQKLYEKYADYGFEILDFPCNQFGAQASGTDEEIAKFREAKYGLTFRQFAKTEVNGENESPLFAWLKQQKGGFGSSKIKWNFTKFLIDRNGNVAERFASTTTPEKMENKIKELL